MPAGVVASSFMHHVIGLSTRQTLHAPYRPVAAGTRPWSEQDGDGRGVAFRPSEIRRYGERRESPKAPATIAFALSSCVANERASASWPRARSSLW